MNVYDEYKYCSVYGVRWGSALDSNAKHESTESVAKSTF